MIRATLLETISREVSRACLPGKQPRLRKTKDPMDPAMRRLLALLLITAAPLAVAQDTQARKDTKDADLAKKSNVQVDKSLAGDLTRKVEERGKDAPALEYDRFRLGV